LAHNHRKGRKRKPGPRAKSGRPSEAYTTIARDNGTMELQRNRKLIVGDEAGHVPGGGVGAVGRWPAEATATSLA
jgi:hypothetical protein